MSLVKRQKYQTAYENQLRVSVRPVGQEAVAAAFGGIKAGVRNRVLKAACRKQAAKGAKIAKARLAVTKRTGQLRKSLGFVYRNYKNGSVWVYVVGPRRGFDVRISSLSVPAQRRLLRVLGKRAKRRLSERMALRVLQQNVDPTYYAHLVEGGRTGVWAKRGKVLSGNGGVWGTITKGVKPRPFMEPAAAAVAGNADEMAADLKAGIGREAAKYAAKGKTILG